MGSKTDSVVFLDSSIALTAGTRIGQAYAPRVLEMAAEGRFAAVTDSLTIQEVEEFGARELCTIFSSVLYRVLPFTFEDWELSAQFASRYPHISPRVRSHGAVMIRRGIEKIYALRTTGYEEISGVKLLGIDDTDSGADRR